MNAPVQPPLRVMCVDDNGQIADALQRRIEQEPTLAWVGSRTGQGDCTADIRELKPNIVLMDIEIPDVDTFAVVEQLTREVPEIRVVMLSGHLHPNYLRQAVDSGAWGYLSKSESPAELIRAIWRVARGEIAFSHEVEIMQKKLFG